MKDKGEHIPDYAREPLARGECAVGFFHGQTAVFIPRILADTLGGRQEIRNRLLEVFPQEILDNFCVGEFECPSYILLEIPPKQSIEDDRVRRFIEKLNK